MAAVELLIDLYCRLLKVAIAACLAVMVVLVFTNVVMRYLFNSGIPTSEELSRWLLVWLTFLGAIVALRQHAHLGVDTLVRALPVDAVRRRPAHARQLETGGADLRRQRARLRHLGRRVFLLLRARVRRFRSCDPVAGSRPRAERQSLRGGPGRGEGKRRACLISGETARDARRLHLLAARRHGAGHAD